MTEDDLEALYCDISRGYIRSRENKKEFFQDATVTEDQIDEFFRDITKRYFKTKDKFKNNSGR